MNVRGLVSGALVLCACAIPASAQPVSILVMPFELRGAEPSFAWLQEGVAIRLSDELEARRVETFGHRQRQQIMAYLNLSPGVAVSRPTAVHVGRLLDADRVIVGTIELTNAEFVVMAESMSVGADRVERIVEQGPLDAFAAITARVAERLAGGAPRDPTGRPWLDASPDVFELYVKGLVARAPQVRFEFLEAALDRAPDDHRIRAALWAVAMELGEDESALDLVQSAPPDAEPWPTGELLAALSLTALGRLEEAEAILVPHTAAPTDAVPLTCRGLLELRRGAPEGRERAKYYLHEAVLQDPDDPDALFNLGYAYWVSGDPQAAAYWLKQAVRRRPTDAEARWLLGLAFERQGLARQGAIEHAVVRMLGADADGLEADLTASVERMVPMFRSREEFVDAIGRQRAAALRHAIGADQRRRSLFHLEEGKALLEAGDDVAAHAALERSLRLMPDQAEPYLLLAGIHLRAERHAAAVEMADLSSWFAESVAARLVGAEAYYGLGDRDAARRELARALQLDPASSAGAELQRRIDPVVPQ